MSQQSVMQFNQEAISYSEVLEGEYSKAVKNGFKGTFEEYCAYRDYIEGE